MPKKGMDNMVDTDNTVMNKIKKVRVYTPDGNFKCAHVAIYGTNTSNEYFELLYDGVTYTDLNCFVEDSNYSSISTNDKVIERLLRRAGYHVNEKEWSSGIHVTLSPKVLAAVTGEAQQKNRSRSFIIENILKEKYAVTGQIAE